MQRYVREHPPFALCRLNCGLCPRDHTQGSSRCPGCADFSKAKSRGVESYITELAEKVAALEFLIESCNDGRRKAFFCTAVNLLPLDAAREVMHGALADR